MTSNTSYAGGVQGSGRGTDDEAVSAGDAQRRNLTDPQLTRLCIGGEPELRTAG